MKASLNFALLLLWWTEGCWGWALSSSSLWQRGRSRVKGPCALRANRSRSGTPGGKSKSKSSSKAGKGRSGAKGESVLKDARKAKTRAGGSVAERGGEGQTQRTGRSFSAQSQTNKRLTKGVQNWDFKTVMPIAKCSANEASADVETRTGGRGRGAKRAAVYSALSAYCSHFSDLISEELKNEKTTVYGRLSQWPSAKLAQSGYAVLGLCGQTRGRLFRDHVVRFTLPASSRGSAHPALPNHKFAAGDIVVISSGDEAPLPLSEDMGEGGGLPDGVLEGVVLDRSYFYIDVALAILPEGLGGASGQFRLDQVVNGVSYDRQFEALRSITDPTGEFMCVALKNLVLSTFEATIGTIRKVEGGPAGARVASIDIGSSRTSDSTSFSSMASRPPSQLKFTRNDIDLEMKYLARGVGDAPALNKVQVEAVKRALGQSLTLIQGPPGTGKTKTATRILVGACRLRKRQPGSGGVLAAAFSNVATDNLLQGCLEQGLKCVRIGHPATVRPELRGSTLEAQIVEHPLVKQQSSKSSQAREAEMAASRAILSSADIVIATCVGSGSPRLNSALGLDNPLVFSTILIDEATQASEPSCLVPLIQGCRQLILVGDQNQLPPTVMSVEAKRKGLGASLFARFLLAGAIPTVLTTQYRMHPVIAQFPSQRFYAGRLLSFPKPHERLAPKGFSWPNPAAPVAFVPVTKGNERRAGNGVVEEVGPAGSGGFSWENMAEVQAVTACVKALIESGDVGKDGSGIGVITPYSAQARALCDAIQSSHPLCEVKTVDAYQGREKEIIIISTVRSNERGSVGFLADWRRLNVAITRGRRGIITFGDPRTLAKDINWAAYIRWCSQEGLILDQSAEND